MGGLLGQSTAEAACQQEVGRTWERNGRTKTEKGKQGHQGRINMSLSEIPFLRLI